MSKETSELKLRLEAVKQTRQITNAMYLLSASLTKKAMQNIDFNLSYLQKLRSTMRDILFRTKENDIKNRFIKKHTEGVTLFIVITADKRLCGSYNSDIIKLAKTEMAKHDEVILASFGNVGNEMFAKEEIKVDYWWSDVLQHPTIYFANAIQKMIVTLFVRHKVKQAYVVFTEYTSSTKQTAVCRRILPLLRRDFGDVNEAKVTGAAPIYEPSAEEAFARIVPQYLTGLIYDIFTQAFISENTARMKAMQTATDNADQMIKNLSDRINNERQLGITNEILEISAATEIDGAV